MNNRQLRDDQALKEFGHEVFIKQTKMVFNLKKKGRLIVFNLPRRMHSRLNLRDVEMLQIPYWAAVDCSVGLNKQCEEFKSYGFLLNGFSVEKKKRTVISTL